MFRDTRRNRLVTVLVALGAFGALLTAQEGRQREGRGGPPAKTTPMHRVAGVRDGVSVFPKVDYAQLKPLKAGEVDFTHYHSYEETAALLKMWAAKYPDLVDLYSAGQSFEGREIWQITISNKKTGKDTDKPAFFLEGGRHAARSAASRPRSTSSITCCRGTAPTRRSPRSSTPRPCTCARTTTPTATPCTT